MLSKHLPGWGWGPPCNKIPPGEGKGETDHMTSDGIVIIGDNLLVYHTTRNFFKLLVKTWMNI